MLFRPVDMRKDFDGLSALVTQGLRQDSPSGNCYLFANRPRTRAKVLIWDGTGSRIYQKRLQQARFAALLRDDHAPTLTLRMSELRLFVEGRARRPPRALTDAMHPSMPAGMIPGVMRRRDPATEGGR